MVVVVKVTEMIVVVVYVIVVVAVMVLVGMMVMVMEMVWWIVGREHFRVGRRVSGHHRGRGGFECRGCGHRTHFPATCGRGHALVTHGLYTMYVSYFIVSAIRTAYTQQITEKKKFKISKS